MASRKRSRDPFDLGNGIDPSSPFSTHPTSAQKRSRLALAAERGGSVVSDEDDDTDNLGSEAIYLDPSPGLGTDLEDEDVVETRSLRSETMGLYDSDDVESDDELNDHIASQALHREYAEHKENVEADHGVIEEVFCRNFMCHSKLRIRLGPLINFIIGHNGSGKSAVLTALTMCLGGKATSTNRGASLKSLIKEGEETATLAVRIKNKGEGAYKPQIYGEHITVERNFSRSGTSGFKIKNSQDKVISTKKADLDDISDFFAFQLDNPINVLNQDMARQFLSNSTPADKYKFFIRGTQLETLDTDYRLMEEHIDNIRNKLQTRGGDIEMLKAKVDEADAKRKRLLEAGALQDKILHSRRMHAWAQVEEQESLLTNLNEELTAAEGRVLEKEQIGVDTSAEYDGQDQTHATAQNQIVMLEEQLQPSREEYGTAKEAFDENKDKLMEARTEQRNIKDDLKRYNRNVDQLGNQIRDEQTRLQEAEGSEHTDRLQKLEELKSAAAQAKDRFEELGSERNLLDKKEEAENAERGAKIDSSDKREAYERAESQLQSMQRSEGRPFDGYNQNMPNLVRAIELETRWRDRPVGPMGKHIRLLNLDWQPQLERMLNDVLPAFAVTNKPDKDLLMSIMRRVNCVQTIFVGNSRPLDTSPNEPPENITTMLRVLRIDNDLVRNQIIINNSAEQTALTPIKRDAEEMVSGPNRVRNVRSAIAYGADRSYGVRFEATRTGNLKTTPVPKFTGRLRMKTDRDTQIRAEQQRVNLAKEAYNSAENIRLQRRAAFEKASQDLQRLKNERARLKIAMQRAEDSVQQQQSEIDDNLPQDGKLQELERQLTEAQAELESVQRSYQDSVNNTDILGQKGKELKLVMDEAQSVVMKGTQQLEKARDRAQRASDDRHHALLAKNEALQAIEDAKRGVERIQERREKQLANVEEFVEAASQITPRIAIEAGATTDILEQRITDLTRLYHQREREAGGTREQLTSAWSKAVKEHKTANKQMQDMQKLQRTLIYTLANRKRRWQKFRKHIVRRARWNFTYLLSERKFRGEVLVNHENKQLDIKVEPDMAHHSAAGREARTLSGGEKSFSTICLLLSIWDAMGSPIRCLDEFDVFMDSVNRQASMSMMIVAARRSVGKQFILITPQAMNNVTLGDDVRIYRMSDPERGQTTLEFGG